MQPEMKRGRPTSAPPGGREPGTIKDTIWIPTESTVVIRMRFKQFIGKAVFHCHILPHEDTGMMQNLLIKPKNQPFPRSEEHTSELQSP